MATPLALVLVSTWRSGGVRGALASVGLRPGQLLRGVHWAVLLGVAITAIQAAWGQHGSAIREMVADGRALVLFPVALLFMLATAGFTEEFFFRGFLQTRIERLLGSRWGAVATTALLFALYHLPYALLHPRWPSHGDWGAAWSAAMTEGILGGLLLGGLYVLSRGNLVACVLFHALVDAAPAMTMIRFGGR